MLLLYIKALGEKSAIFGQGFIIGYHNCFSIMTPAKGFYFVNGSYFSHGFLEFRYS